MTLLLLFTLSSHASIGFLPKNLTEGELDRSIPLLYCLADRTNTHWELAASEKHNPLLKVFSAPEGPVAQWTKDGETQSFPLTASSTEEICIKLSPPSLAPVTKADELPAEQPKEKKVKAWHYGVGAAVLGLGAFLLLRPNSSKHPGVVLE